MSALALSFALLLPGCESDSTTTASSEGAAAQGVQLVSAYPQPNQAGVKNGSVLKLVFDQDPEQLSVLVVPVDASLATVQLEQQPADSLSLYYRMQGIVPGAMYRVSVSKAGATALSSQFVFRSGGPVADSRALPEVVFASPLDLDYPLTSASSVHLLFSHWISPASVGSADIQLTREGIALDVEIKQQKDRLLIRPVHGLSSTGPYRLRVASLKDLHGQEMSPYEFDFNVESLGELSRLNVVSSTVAGAGSSAGFKSSLIGKEEIQFQYETGAYLGDPALFDGYNPVLLKKGTQFRGASIDLKLGGILPTGLSSETLRFSLLNDAVGYISKNRLTDSFDSPQTVSFVLDLAVSADDERVNALIAQELLGVQVSGRALIAGNQFLFDLDGVAQLDLLEAASIDASLKLRLETTEQGTLDHQDFQPPTLLSSRPATNEDYVDTREPLRLFFDEALSDRSVQNHVSLRKENAPSTIVPATLETHGAEVVIQPVTELDASTRYVVIANPGVEDLAGNMSVEIFEMSFKTNQSSQFFTAAPRLTSVYPGVACALESANWANNVAGRCGEMSGVSGQRYSVFTLPADQKIVLNFSSQMEESSLNLSRECGQDAAIRIERVDWTSGNVDCLEAVSGSVMVDGSRWTFSPDAELEVGGQYQLVLHAGSGSTCGTNEICGANGKPLETQALDASWSTGGGSDVEIPFVVGAVNAGDTFQVLRSAEVADVSGNHLVSAIENSASLSRMKLKIDVCDQTSCSYGSSICSYPGDPTPSSSNFSCNPDAPRTRIGNSIAFTSSSTLYTSAVLPVRLEGPLLDVSLGADYIPVRVPAAILPVTEFDMRVVAAWIVGVNINSGPLYLRVRQEGAEGSSTDVRGRIVKDPNSPSGGSKFEVELNAYLDAPDLDLPGTHNLKNRELYCKLSGPIEFNNQGQMRILLQNESAIKIPMAVTGTFLGAGNGDVVFEIEAGDFQLDLVASN